MVRFIRKSRQWIFDEMTECRLTWPIQNFHIASLSFPLQLQALRYDKAVEGSPRAQLEERRKAAIYERYSTARMQTSINNSISSSLRRHDRSVASRGRRRERRGRSGNTEGTTIQKRANWIATRGTARRSCVPSQWRMCEKISRQWWSRRRIGNLDAVIALAM